MPDGLNPRHAVFVEEYLKTRNGTQAALAAGYTSGGQGHPQAAATAVRLLRNSKIIALIEARDAAFAAKTGITKDWLVRETVRTYQKALDLDQSSAARGALDLLARLHGLIIEKRENRNIDWNNVSDDDLQQLVAAANAAKAQNSN